LLFGLVGGNPFDFGIGGSAPVYAPRVLSIEETIAVFTKAVQEETPPMAEEVNGSEQQQKQQQKPQQQQEFGFGGGAAAAAAAAAKPFGAPPAAPPSAFGHGVGGGAAPEARGFVSASNDDGTSVVKKRLFRKIPGIEPPPFLIVPFEATVGTSSVEVDIGQSSSPPSPPSPPPSFLSPQGDVAGKGEKACDTVVKALLSSNHKSSELVVKQACWAIFTLAKRGADNTSRLGALGACTVLVELLQMHLSTSANVVWYICTALGFLATDTENRTKLVEQTVSCLALLVEVIKTHASNEGVCVAVCWCFANLALDEAHCARLGQAGACQCAVQAMRAHCLKSSLVVEKAAWAIANLACSARYRAQHVDLLRQAGANALLTSICSRSGHDSSCLSVGALRKAQEAMALLA